MSSESRPRTTARRLSTPGVGVASLSGVSSAGVLSDDIANAATEAFDEPLEKATVVQIVSGFVRDAKGLI